MSVHTLGPFHAGLPYRAPRRDLWFGRNDQADQYIHQKIVPVDISQQHAISQSAASIAVIGFAVDEGVKRNQGRIGARHGPEQLRKFLGPMPWAFTQIQTAFDLGDIVCVDGDLERSQQALGTVIDAVHRAGIHSIVIGGGHEIAYGSYLGCHERFGNDRVGIINFDAHYDLRTCCDRGNSGTPFWQIYQLRRSHTLPFNYLVIGTQEHANSVSLRERAKSLGVQSISAFDIFCGDMTQNLKRLARFIEACDHIYLSLCMDVFSHAYVSGVSAPQALGLEPWQVLVLLKQIVSSGKVLCFDIAELSPPLDANDHSARLAATLLWQYLAAHDARKKLNSF